MPAFTSNTGASANKNPESVLSTPLKGGKALVEKRQQTLRKRNKRRAYTYLVFSLVLLGVYSMTFLYPQAIAYLEAPERIATIESQIEQYEEVKIPNLEEERALHRSAYEEEFGAKEDIITRLLPNSEDREGVTRRLENFATSLNAVNPPFELDSLSFGELKEEGDLQILPISMSIHSSRSNFDRFLQLIELSGQLETEDGVYIRLMEIANISTRYRGTDPRTGEDLGVDFSVKLNAYSRK